MAVSPQFYAWIFGLGAAARIMGPETVVAGMQALLETVRAAYLEK